MSNEEESKYSFGQGSREPRFSNPQHIASLKGRTSEQVREKYRLSQGGSRRPEYSNFTEDDIGNEGITELFNYLSDSETEESKRHSVGVAR